MYSTYDTFISFFFDRNLQTRLQPETMKWKSRQRILFNNRVDSLEGKDSGQEHHQQELNPKTHERGKESNLLTSYDFDIIQLTDFRSRGRSKVSVETTDTNEGINSPWIQRGWKVLGSISTDGSYSPISLEKKNQRPEEDNEQEEGSNEDEISLQSSSERDEKNTESRDSKHGHWRNRFSTTSGERRRMGDASSSSLFHPRRNLFRVVSAVAPPFVQESTRIQNATCLTGVSCLRVRLCLFL